ncbi:hypothetical protein TTHERM_000113309 (macronuclear) [Tetrahymena thermophila SB210]|uniref:Uncharacterized protein n=1 Tax=Tetrahymena thermophila (strain SB210) TaxID=312017 RepID=W7XFX4_TETTS|nr:hypothetical protein TTHERM_000113309 [Tetrahymena thermophila SB210]EWS75783.1 hypothetical protein TTHERM_000113309 [Tetrahymena thermophila SB210]|eukprot:XP_012651705.1 hypothetical protein TTHERM_000113309 [Tetrahymena thermophila SB210]
MYQLRLLRNIYLKCLITFSMKGTTSFLFRTFSSLVNTLIPKIQSIQKQKSNDYFQRVLYLYLHKHDIPFLRSCHFRLLHFSNSIYLCIQMSFTCIQLFTLVPSTSTHDMSLIECNLLIYILQNQHLLNLRSFLRKK